MQADALGLVLDQVLVDAAGEPVRHVVGLQALAVLVGEEQPGDRGALGTVGAQLPLQARDDGDGSLGVGRLRRCHDYAVGIAHADLTNVQVSIDVVAPIVVAGAVGHVLDAEPAQLRIAQPRPRGGVVERPVRVGQPLEELRDLSGRPCRDPLGPSSALLDRSRDLHARHRVAGDLPIALGHREHRREDALCLVHRLGALARVVDPRREQLLHAGV